MVRVRCVAALAVIAMVLSGCSGSDEKPLNHAQLKARLLNASTVPPGAKVVDVGDDAGDGVPVANGLDCDSLISLAGALSDDKAVRPVADANVMVNSRPADGGSLWLGNEFLLNFHGDDAHRVLVDVRSLVGKCPPEVSEYNITTTYRVAPDLGLGDEGLYLRASLTDEGGRQMERQSAAVRVGNTLIVISATTAILPGAPSPTDPMIKAAFHRFTSA